MPIVRADAELSQAGGPRQPAGRGQRAAAAATAACAIALVGYAAAAAAHPALLSWFDLRVYRDAGLIARHAPGALYSWQLQPGIKFTYPPFAAVLFAAGSVLPWPVLAAATTMTSLAAVVLVAWLTFRSLGWRGRNLAAAALALSAVALWTEPVQRALQLGQVELVLMLLIVWDLGQPDRRWWKGAGIGLAAGIKLVPLIFLPYLLLTGRLRQAAAAAAAFAVTVLIGFAFLPAASVKWWLTGYFFHPGKVGAVGALVNQSLLSSITRLAGTVAAATPLWLAVSAVTGAAGLAAAAMLHRAGRPASGWLACALTGLLISPVSWDHHWVWIVPMLALVADAAIRAGRRARWCYGALAAVLAVVFGAWPGRWSGRGAFTTHGLLGFFPTPGQIGDAHLNSVYRLHGVQLLSWNLFVLAGLSLLAVLVAAAWRARADGPDRGGARGAPAPYPLTSPDGTADRGAADRGAADGGAADGGAADGGTTDSGTTDSRAAGAAAP